MKVANQQQSEAIARLSLSKDGKMFNEFLDEALAEVSSRLALDENPARVRLYQGEAQTLLAMKKLLNPVSN